jgi:mycofactocin system FadH/OYE family oxidoreductase 2
LTSIALITQFRPAALFDHYYYHSFKIDMMEGGTMQEQFRSLFNPLKVGPLMIRNRIMSAAHITRMIDPGPISGGPGFMGEQYAYYQAERAKGGVGLIICGYAGPHPSISQGAINAMMAYDKKAIPGFRLVTDTIHKYGATTFLQLAHTGSLILNTERSMMPPFSPSGLASALGSEPPKIMEIEDIEEIIEYFGKSAENTKSGGFDGVEIHSTHGSLLQQFLSPVTNKREDEYGGSLDNRMRLLLQVITRVKGVIGENMALGVRLCGEEFFPGGLTPDDAKEIAIKLEDTDKVDYISISIGHGSFSSMWVAPTMYIPAGYAVYASAAIKRAVNHIPVFVAGRITDPVYAEKILSDGYADMVGMTRALIADPEWPNKALEGRLDEIRKCTGCNQNCLGRTPSGVHVGCTQNPAVGKEKEWGIGTLKPATKRKTVMIAGGGPGGMEVAWIAAARGHQVTLYEKTDKLGGQINLARKFPGCDEMDGYAYWRIQQMAKYKVKVVFEQEVTVELVDLEKPDAVVVATGSRPFLGATTDWLPEPISGWKQDNVVSCEDILEERVNVGKRVVVLDIEGRTKGLPTADMLALQGKDVEFVTPLALPGAKQVGESRSFLQGRAAKNGVRFTPSSFITKISRNTITITNFLSKKERIEEGIDTLILVTHGKPNDELYFALKGRVPELYRIGNCVATRTVDRAIYQGHVVGRLL